MSPDPRPAVIEATTLNYATDHTLARFRRKLLFWRAWAIVATILLIIAGWWINAMVPDGYWQFYFHAAMGQKTKQNMILR